MATRPIWPASVSEPGWGHRHPSTRTLSVAAFVLQQRNRKVTAETMRSTNPSIHYLTYKQYVSQLVSFVLKYNNCNSNLL